MSMTKRSALYASSTLSLRLPALSADSAVVLRHFQVVTRWCRLVTGGACRNTTARARWFGSWTRSRAMYFAPSAFALFITQALVIHDEGREYSGTTSYV